MPFKAGERVLVKLLGFEEQKFGRIIRYDGQSASGKGQYVVRVEGKLYRDVPPSALSHFVTPGLEKKVGSVRTEMRREVATHDLKSGRGRYGESPLFNTHLTMISKDQDARHDSVGRCVSAWGRDTIIRVQYMSCLLFIFGSNTN